MWYPVLTTVSAIGVGIWIGFHWGFKNGTRKKILSYNMEDARVNARAKTICKVTSDAMETVPGRLRTMDRMVLVSYDDLLKIWDNADKLKWGE